jgi:SRSO17 transposase
MDTSALTRVGEQLDAFAGEVFSRISGRRRGLYVRALTLEGRPNSMQQMAQRLRVNHQRLQQFLTAALVRKHCRARVRDTWSSRMRGADVSIDDAGFAKDGDRSRGVARQYSGTLGNCQIVFSVHAPSVSLDWRRVLPAS